VPIDRSDAADAARYRWLRDRLRVLAGQGTDGRRRVWLMMRESLSVSAERIGTDEPEVDELVDACPSGPKELKL